jgi:hypothetical protein
MAGGQTVLQGGMYSTCRQRRNHSGGVTDQQHALSRHRPHHPAARNHAGAHRCRPAVPKIEQRRDLVEERRHRGGRCGLAVAHAARESDLHDANSRHYPGKIAGRDAPVDEAMHPVGIGDIDTLVLVLDAEKEFRATPEPERLRHARLRPVRTHQKARGARLAQVESAWNAYRAREGFPVINARAGLLRPLREPAHDAWSVGGEKVVAGRGKIHVTQAGRVEAHAVNAMNEIGRQAVEQRNLVHGILHDDAGSVELLARIGLLLQHRHPHSRVRQRGRAREARETRAHDHAIVLESRHAQVP